MEVKTVLGKCLPRGNLARRQTVKEIPNKGNFNVAFLGLLLCIMYSIPRSVIKTSMTVRLKNIQTEGEEKAMICFNFEAFILIGSNDKNF